jgi:transcriptional regulator with XRE-family HTH domain
MLRSAVRTTTEAESGGSVELAELDTPPMDHDEKTFFAQLGRRIAERRKAQGLTQTQLGDVLGVTQQQVGHFEVARRRVPVSMLPLLAQALALSVEELLGGEPPKGRKRGPAPKLQQLERLSRLPRAQQQFISKTLDALLRQAEP